MESCFVEETQKWLIKRTSIQFVKVEESKDQDWYTVSCFALLCADMPQKVFLDVLYTRDVLLEKDLEMIEKSSIDAKQLEYAKDHHRQGDIILTSYELEYQYLVTRLKPFEEQKEATPQPSTSQQQQPVKVPIVPPTVPATAAPPQTVYYAPGPQQYHQPLYYGYGMMPGYYMPPRS